MKKGKFIVLEGLDGSGTTTQLNLLKNYLEANNIKVWVTCEPTSNEIGNFLKKCLSKEIKEEITPEAYMYLYAADRTVHCEQIKEHLYNGEWVICDRYIYSSYAYQGKDINNKILYDINERFIKPDVTFYINTPIDECLKRIDSRGAKKELYEEREILEKVFIGYMNCFNTITDNIVMISGLSTPENICKNIVKYLGVN